MNKNLKRFFTFLLILTTICIPLSNTVIAKAEIVKEWTYTIYDKNGNITETGIIHNGKYTWDGGTITPDSMIVFQYPYGNGMEMDPGTRATISYNLNKKAKHMVRVSHLSTYSEYNFETKSNSFVYRAEAPFRTGYSFAIKNKSSDTFKLLNFSVEY